MSVMQLKVSLHFVKQSLKCIISFDMLCFDAVFLLRLKNHEFYVTLNCAVEAENEDRKRLQKKVRKFFTKLYSTYRLYVYN